MIGNQYMNLANGSVIEVLEVKDNLKVKVATLIDSNGMATTQRRVRTMLRDNLFDSRLKANGQPRTSGWVPAAETATHTSLANKTQAVPATTKKEPSVTAQISEPSTWDEVDLESMSTEALIQYGHKLDVQAKQAKDAADGVKAELKKRSKRPGVTIVGESVYDLGRNMNFSQALAVKKLTAQQLAMVSVTTTEVDSKKAQALFGKDSPLYQSLLVPADNYTLKLRTVTEKDLLAQMGGQYQSPFGD